MTTPEIEALNKISRRLDALRDELSKIGCALIVLTTLLALVALWYV